MNKKSPMRMCVGCHEMREKKRNDPCFENAGQYLLY